MARERPKRIRPPYKPSVLLRLHHLQFDSYWLLGFFARTIQLDIVLTELLTPIADRQELAIEYFRQDTGVLGFFHRSFRRSFLIRSICPRWLSLFSSLDFFFSRISSRPSQKRWRVIFPWLKATRRQTWKQSWVTFPLDPTI